MYHVLILVLCVMVEIVGGDVLESQILSSVPSGIPMRNVVQPVLHPTRSRASCWSDRKRLGTPKATRGTIVYVP